MVEEEVCVSVMDNILDFSEEEIEQQLASLGYRDIPKHRLRQFKRDLDELIRHEKSKSHDESSFLDLSSYTVSSHPSPPAVIKEKLNQSCIEDPGDVFFLHSGNPDRERQVLMPCQNQYNGTRMEGHCDSYAQHSVAPRSTRPSSAPTSLEVEPGPTDTRYTFNQTSTPDRDTGQAHGRNFIKRKVLRKHKGQRVVCDESVHSEELDAVSGLEERLGGLHVSTPTQENFEPEHEGNRSQSDEQSSENDGLSAFEAYIRGMSRMQTHHDFKPKPKSFIRPARGHPHTRNLKKTDPVTKYFEYKQHWETFKLPGERDRKVLHREIREQLAYQPPPPKPRKVFVPNTYVVPTDKKRTALRWEIRNDLANGLVPPPRLNYRF